MHHIVNVYSAARHGGHQIPKYPPVLSVPDPLKPRLKADKNDAAEARYAAQRELIDAYKKKNPEASANKMFADLTQRHPDVFHDDGGDDDEDNGTGDEKVRLDAKREVVSDFRAAHPEMDTDRIYATLIRLNPEFFED